MNKKMVWIVLFVIAGSIGAWYFSTWETTQDHPSVVTLSPSVVDESPPQETYPVIDIPLPLAPVPEPLPSLADSDAEISEKLSGLIGPELLGSHFILEQVISRIVTTIDSLDQRQLAPLVLPVQVAAGKFQVVEGEAISIDPANSQRYSAYMQIISATDTSSLIELYVTYYPLFQEAYSELGHGEEYFNDRLVSVLDHLLQTPEVSDDVALLKPEAVYIYADENLESLSAGQKLLLRIGSSNSAVLVDKLKEIRSALTRQDI
jgi:hypothetical protein